MKKLLLALWSFILHPIRTLFKHKTTSWPKIKLPDLMRPAKIEVMPRVKCTAKTYIKPKDPLFRFGSSYLENLMRPLPNERPKRFRWFRLKHSIVS